MVVALEAPDRVSALVPVDNAPVNAKLKSDFGKYVRGMQHIEAENVTKQSDADKILQQYEEVSCPSPVVRSERLVDVPNAMTHEIPSPYRSASFS